MTAVVLKCSCEVGLVKTVCPPGHTPVVYMQRSILGPPLPTVASRLKCLQRPLALIERALSAVIYQQTAIISCSIVLASSIIRIGTRLRGRSRRDWASPTVGGPRTRASVLIGL